MIQGVVSLNGLPMIQVQVANQEWAATIDTGFNGDAVPDRRGHSKMPALFYQPCKSKWFVVYLKKRIPTSA